MYVCPHSQSILYTTPLIFKGSTLSFTLTSSCLKNETVINLSQYKLDEEETKNLSFGLNYALLHKRLPIKDIISSTEHTARSLPPKQAQLLRDNVKDCIKDLKQNNKSNLSNKQQKDLSKLKENDSVVILPADKATALLLWTNPVITKKIEELLDDKTYAKMKKDPTKEIERQLTTKIKDLVKNDEMNQKLKTKIISTNSYTPQLYGLPKIHKKDIPLRPIVASIGSPTYSIEKELARILSPLRGKTDSYIKNSHHFVHKLTETTIQDCELMVSFDVKSLFTQVPINEALEVIEEQLKKDETLEDRTTLSPLTITDLIKFSMSSTYFGYEGNIYKQLEEHQWVHLYHNHCFAV